MNAPKPLVDRFSHHECADQILSIVQLDDFGDVTLHTEMPDWWTENGNELYVGNGVWAPPIEIHPGKAPPRNTVAVLAGSIEHILLWEDNSTIAIGRRSKIYGSIACGGSTIIVGPDSYNSGGAALDSRNGGLILIGPDQLWARDVEIMTDDMHAIRDMDGRRINDFGGKIVLDKHVWLGQQAMVRGGALIQENSIVGARSMVAKPFPPGVVLAGVPARVVRENVTWSPDDLP